MKKLEGRIAIVTGADSGIGRAVAEEFAKEGADVVVTFHTDRAGADETGARVAAAGRRAIVRQADVRDEAAVAAFFADAERELGAPPYILVNNAGIGGGGKPVADLETADFDAVIKTDLYGPFFCIREFVRRRRGLGGAGKIINVTSVHEVTPSPNNVAYVAAKGGLLALTRSLALELAPLRINVNALAPGLIATPMTAERVYDPEARRRELPNIPWGRPGQPHEVARLALYLASEDADYVTGQSFTIDGGLETNWGQGA